jgi:predicted NACHT family NTPase
LAKVSEPAVVLLGAPGSGKSTLLRHFELNSATQALTDEANNVTFFLSLNSFPKETLISPLDWLKERWQTSNPDLPPLMQLLRERRLILLLDALNEIPIAKTNAIDMWQDFLQDLVQTYPGNRIIFSCRTLDFSAPLSIKDVLEVPQVRIEALTDGQVQEFLDAYCPDYSSKLWNNLKHSQQLDLLRLPYYLKLLVEQTQAGEVPNGRAALFTGFVRQALKREITGKNPLFKADEFLHERDIERLNRATAWKTPFELPERGILINKLADLAYQMQSQRQSNEVGQMRVSFDEALALLNYRRDEELLEAGEALGIIDQDINRDEVLFFHHCCKSILPPVC